MPQNALVREFRIATSSFTNSLNLQSKTKDTLFIILFTCHVQHIHTSCYIQLKTVRIDAHDSIVVSCYDDATRQVGYEPLDSAVLLRHSGSRCPIGGARGFGL
jgi:hypothetical protein